MTGDITNLPPGKVGPIAAGWTVELDAIPHSAAASSPSTGVVSFSAVADYDAHLLLNNSSTFVYTDDFAIDLPEVLVGGASSSAAFGYGANGYGTGAYDGLATTSTGDSAVYESPGELEVTANISGVIDSVSLSGNSGTFTQGTAFTKFATRDMDIPAVTSGSPVAAYNLAWQMAGNRPWTYTNSHGTYWPLRGHDAGFNVKNTIVPPLDNTTYKLDSTGASWFRKWKVHDSFAALGWDVADGEFWCTSGVGFSVKVGARQRNLLSGTTDLNGRSFVLQFGSSNSGDFLGFGPDDAKNQHGKYFVVSLHGPTASATITGKYRSGGGWVSVSKTVALTGVDMTTPVQFLVDIGYPTSTGFLLTAYIQNVDSTDSPIVISTGLLATAVDVYAAPFKTSGYLHGLFVTWENYNYDESVLLGTYEDWSSQPISDLTKYGIGSPILSYTGSLWDYLAQVCVARQVGIRNLSDQVTISAMSDDSIRAQIWNPAATPSFSLDNSNDSTAIEIEAKLVSLGKSPVIYNGLDDGQIFSVTPGTVAQFSITTSTVNSLVYNPEPLFDYTDFLTGSHPYGAYIVTASDNLPIEVAEWISYGGSVTVQQSGQSTVTITVVAPVIPLSSDATGDYSLSISDGQTSHPMFKLATPAGGKVLDNTTTFQTGSSFAGQNSSTSTVSNIAITDLQSLQNAATWSIAEATGPTLSLSAEFPLADLSRWQSGDFGFIPGATLLYRNLQWRIMSATVSNLSVKFTATPYLTYRSEYFPFNWDGYTVDDYASFWEGKTYDDMATMTLAGPNYDWSNQGAIARYDLYPGGGSLNSDLGLLPDPALLPDPSLEPDAPSTSIVGATFPGSTEYPSATEYLGIKTIQTLEDGTVYPSVANLFPGSQADPQ